MAKPRVFISSTFYDLRHIRTDVEHFVIEMGYEPIRNENGDIPYGTHDNLEEYCYHEVVEVDILVGIIGGRYGSESKDKKYSITQTEIRTAFEEGKQVYIFIDKNVLSEFHTYSVNKGSAMKFYYADNIKIYEFIEEIFAIKGGIIIAPFENVIDITRYLKTQWAGLFRDMLRDKSEAKRMSKLSSQIEDLKIISESLKNYIEISLPDILNNKPEADKIIEKENTKITDKRVHNILNKNPFFQNLIRFQNVSLDNIKDLLIKSNNLSEFSAGLVRKVKYPAELESLVQHAILHINDARALLGLELFPVSIDYKSSYSFNHDGTIHFIDQIKN